MVDLISNSYPLYNGDDLYVDGYGYQCFERKRIFLPPRICMYYHMLHFVIKGKGVLTLDGKTYPLNQGALFYCPSNTVLTYHTSLDDPYSYYWFNFTGKDAEKKVNSLGLSKDNPVIYPQNAQNILEIFRKLMPLAKLPDTQDVALGSLYSLFYYAKDNKSAPNKKQSSIYVEKAIENINANFFNPDLKINHIAEQLHLSIEYLSKIFKEETGTTPIAYLISRRMEEANKLLKLGFTVSATAEKCGYIDMCNFSKTYSKHFGHPPSKTLS